MKTLIINLLVWLRIIPQKKKIYKEILSKADQIEILQEAITNFDKLILESYGICIIISTLLEHKLNIPFVYYLDVHKYIPSFTHKNCIRLGELYNFPINNHLQSRYWWSINDKHNRLKCLEVLLIELKKEK